MTAFVITAGLSILLGAQAPRENQRGLESLGKGDTAAALRHLEKAAKADTADARFSYNLGTVQARTRKASSDAAFSQALAHAKTPEEKARILYNRGTARYASAKAKHEAQMAAGPAGMAAPGQPPVGRNPTTPGAQAPGQEGPEDEVNGAIDDLRQSLKIKPQWNEAARNLDLALRLRQQCKKPKPDDKNKDDKQPPKQQPQQQPQPQPQMQQQDAQRLMDAAQAQENSQAKKPARKKDQDDGPDW